MKSYVFRVVIEDDAMETGEKAYHAYCPALKGCHTWGRSYDEALANVREAVELYVKDLRESGSRIPERRVVVAYNQLSDTFPVGTRAARSQCAHATYPTRSETRRMLRCPTNAAWPKPSDSHSPGACRPRSGRPAHP